MLLTVILLFSILIYLTYLFNVPYFVLYWVFYKFSHAHTKPTVDSKIDPKLRHQNHKLYKMVRAYERFMLHHDNTLNSSSVQTPFGVQEISASDINPELFKVLTVNKTRPLVIRGLFNKSPAVKKWSAEYFMGGDYGKTCLTALKGERGDMTYTSFNQKLDCENIKLSMAIANMLAGDTTIYINNITKLFMEYPELVYDIDLESAGRLLGLDINSENWLKLNMFIGQAGTRSSLHCAAGGNLFFLAEGGRKEWTFIPPEYAKYLSMTPAKGFTFAVSEHDIKSDDFDINLRRIPQFKTILEPGDALYNPPLVVARCKKFRWIHNRCSNQRPHCLLSELI